MIPESGTEHAPCSRPDQQPLGGRMAFESGSA